MSLGRSLSNELRGDTAIWLITIVLALVSLLAIYSSTGSMAFRVKGGNTEFFLFKHLLIVAISFIVMYVMYKIPYEKYKKWAPFCLALTFPMLMYTLWQGADINDARRWIAVPFIDLTFQTSDFAKISLVTYVASMIGSKQEYIDDFAGAFTPIIVPILITCGLIAPADLSTAIILFSTCFLMMFIGRVHWKFLGLLLLFGVVIFSLLIIAGQFFPEFVRVDTWTSRLTEYFTNSDGGYQVQQSKIAIASGEWIGVGPGNSTQRNFLPSPFADFIYSIITEEYGLVGAFIMIAMFVWLMIRTTVLVTKSAKAFGAMLAVGFTLCLTIQAFVNIAVAVHVVPVTGVTMPLVSMGGTSFLFASMMIGIILSVSRHIESISDLKE